ncbi:MAG: AlpA family phage regulatory protein [Methylomicrobium sp.]|nr:AlpA family phage regulatory protein [Methylomicrobium sp.]
MANLNLTQIPDDALLRRSQFIPSIIPICPTSWYLGVKSGRYPAPVRLGPRSVAWRASDIKKLVQNGI